MQRLRRDAPELYLHSYLLLATHLVQRLRRDAPELEDVAKTKTKVMVEDGCVAHAFDHRAEYGRAGT